jgi:predicted nucleotidyltransferase component of viral defense system
MATSDRFQYHNNNELFHGALAYTSAETGFSARLLEKDYFCSLILDDLFSFPSAETAFKGGTCFSKVYSSFSRMSEDLDLAISTPIDASRTQRSARIAAIKSHLAGLTRRISCLRFVDHLKGSNNSTQYNSRLAYSSLVTGQDEMIKLEYSVREPILEPIERLPLRTQLLDPFKRIPVVEPFLVPVLSCREAYAEKIRAALTRREPAIRDFFDIDHGSRTGILHADDEQLINLLRFKLAVPGSEPIDISDSKLEQLKKQVLAQLKPVLRESDFRTFDLLRAYRIVKQLANTLIRNNR